MRKPVGPPARVSTLITASDVGPAPKRIKVPPLEEIRAYLDARERAKRGEGSCIITPSGDVIAPSGTMRWSGHQMPDRGAQHKPSPINTMSEKMDVRIKIAAKKVGSLLPEDWRTDQALFRAAVAIDGGVDPRHIRAVLKATSKAGVRLGDLRTVKRLLRHSVAPPDYSRSWETASTKYRALAAAMESRLLPWIKQAKATPWPETLERIREDVELVERFLTAYMADCEAHAQQNERWADDIDQNVVGDHRITKPRSQPVPRRQQVKSALFGDLCGDLERAAVKPRDKTASSILCALQPQAFDENGSPNAIKQRLYRQRNKPATKQKRKRKNPTKRP